MKYLILFTEGQTWNDPFDKTVLEVGSDIESSYMTSHIKNRNLTHYNIINFLNESTKSSKHLLHNSSYHRYYYSNF